MMCAPFKLDVAHQEPEIEKPPIKAAFRGDWVWNFIPRIQRFHAEGTVASPAQLPDSGYARIAPDTCFYYLQICLKVSSEGEIHTEDTACR